MFARPSFVSWSFAVVSVVGVGLAAVSGEGCSSGSVIVGGSGGDGTGSTSAFVSSSSTGVAAPACNDGVKNGAELDVDCGATCPACGNGKACASGADCVSGNCKNGVCAPCGSGADCPATQGCVNGACTTCTSTADCASGAACINGACGPCAANADCSPGQVCQAGACGTCMNNAQCDPGKACTNGVCGACTQNGDCTGGEACINGACGTCASNTECAPTQACVSGACTACANESQCLSGQACVAGGCVSCTNAAECAPGEGCLAGACGACRASTDCKGGEICGISKCYAGTEIQMYQCPGVTSLGGGAWGFYGCQNQLTNTPTCSEIEYPTSQSFPCMPAGRLGLVTAASPTPPPNASFVDMYQCPGVTSLGGGGWGYYGCQNQITNTSTCLEIESPTQQTFPCTFVGKMLLSSNPPSPPSGGVNVPMYQCPGITSLGGGAWGYYGCQNQITNTSSCSEIEYPSSMSFPCTGVGDIVLEP